MSSDFAPILRAADATFAREGATLVAPFSLRVVPGERACLEAPDARVASLRARMLAGIVKVTSGTLSIGEFDPRIQPVQAKRLIGFVSAALAPGDGECPLDRATIEAHADLWDVDRALARAAAADVTVRLGLGGAYARALALTLIRPVALLVLDRPPPELEAIVSERLGLRCAVVSSRVTAPATLRTPFLKVSVA
ncbi:MAG: hypothetical protein ABI346_07495 [Candidatus Baltobacteraceae bacterium]